MNPQNTPIETEVFCGTNFDVLSPRGLRLNLWEGREGFLGTLKGGVAKLCPFS